MMKLKKETKLKKSKEKKEKKQITILVNNNT